MQGIINFRKGDIILFKDHSYGIFARYHEIGFGPEPFFWTGDLLPEALNHMYANPKGYVHGMASASNMWKQACWTTELDGAELVGNAIDKQSYIKNQGYKSRDRVIPSRNHKQIR